MAATENIEHNRLERECKSLKIEANIGRPDGPLLANFNVRSLSIRAIPVAPQLCLLGVVMSH